MCARSLSPFCCLSSLLSLLSAVSPLCCLSSLLSAAFPTLRCPGPVEPQGGTIHKLRVVSLYSPLIHTLYNEVNKIRPRVGRTHALAPVFFILVALPLVKKRDEPLL